jgi:hypothetical protein
MGLCSAVSAQASGCSVIVEPNRQQCNVDADCAARGSGLAGAHCIDTVCVPDPTWGCLGSVVWPPSGKPQPTVTVKFRDVITGTPMTNVSVNICLKQDFECEGPVAKNLMPNAAGDLSFQVAGGFDGYLELSAPDAVPALFFFYPPVVDDRIVDSLPLLSPAILMQVGALAGKPILPERGVALLGTMDCRNILAQGVHIWSTDADAQTSSFYVIKKIPNATAMATDASGEGGLINLKPGSVAISGTLPDGRTIGTVTAVVRAGGITYTSLLPSPE